MLYILLINFNFFQVIIEMMVVIVCILLLVGYVFSGVSVWQGLEMIVNVVELVVVGVEVECNWCEGGWYSVGCIISVFGDFGIECLCVFDGWFVVGLCEVLMLEVVEGGCCFGVVIVMLELVEVIGEKVWQVGVGVFYNGICLMVGDLCVLVVDLQVLEEVLV